MKTKKIGIFDPEMTRDVNLGYVVVDGSGKPQTIEYEHNGQKESYVESTIRIKTAGGCLMPEEFLVTVTDSDAMKELRKGELISIKLKFYVREKEDGNLEQQIIGSDIITLNDYIAMLETQARYAGQQDVKDAQAD